MIFNLMQYDEVRLVEKEEIGNLEEILSWRETESDELIIVFCSKFTGDEIVQYSADIMEITGYNGIEYLYQDNALVYRLYMDYKEHFYEDDTMVISREVYTDGGWRWYDENGNMAVRRDVYLESDGGKWVRFDENGNMVKGEDFRNDGWYYFDPDTGAVAVGAMVLEDGRKVYYDPVTCKMLRGKQMIDGKTYYFDRTDGHLIFGSSRLWK